MHPVLLLAILASLTAVSGVPLVVDGAPAAVIVLPADATPIAVYAAEELAEHIGKASGTRPDIQREPSPPTPGLNAVYVGATQAARDAGIHHETLAGEDSVLRTVDGNLFIVGNDGPGTR